MQKNWIFGFFRVFGPISPHLCTYQHFRQTNNQLGLLKQIRTVQDREGRRILGVSKNLGSSPQKGFLEKEPRKVPQKGFPGTV